MINQNTTPVTVTNLLSPSVTVITTTLQFPVYWEDMMSSWNATSITWNQATDRVAMTNIQI